MWTLINLKPMYLSTPYLRTIMLKHANKYLWAKLEIECSTRIMNIRLLVQPHNLQVVLPQLDTQPAKQADSVFASVSKMPTIPQ